MTFFDMTDFSIILMLQNKKGKSGIDWAKVQIKPEKLTPFGGIFKKTLIPQHYYFLLF